MSVTKTTGGSTGRQMTFDCNNKETLHGTRVIIKRTCMGGESCGESVALSNAEATELRDFLNYIYPMEDM